MEEHQYPHYKRLKATLPYSCTVITANHYEFLPPCNAKISSGQISHYRGIKKREGEKEYFSYSSSLMLLPEATVTQILNFLMSMQSQCPEH